MNTKYDEESIRTLESSEHIRLRPGMYIGKLGDGSSPSDGIYVLIKESIDNAIDEHTAGYGRTIEVNISGNKVSIRDYGRGIPLGSVIDCVSKMNTGAKYDSKVFKKSVGLNGVGSKAVNALSSHFLVKSIREEKQKIGRFEKGKLIEETLEQNKKDASGTYIEFIPDVEVFGEYHFIDEYVERMLRNYTYLNNALTIVYNGMKMKAKNGLLDLLNDALDGENTLYEPIHITQGDVEFTFTHRIKNQSEEYHSFVNGQNTIQGGTHLSVFREALVKTIRDFYNKNYDTADIHQSIVSAISIKVQEPIFESQTKIKLGSALMEPHGQSIRSYIFDAVTKKLDNYLHINSETADILQKKIIESEKERKEISAIKKLSKVSAKKVSLHNKKLRDSRVHLNSNHEKRLDTTLFITEGDSASGSITKTRNVNLQAVFSLKGKPYNSYGSGKKIVYQNEEFNLLQAALNIEEGIENLRYNNIVIATDADVDGMHIRLLLLTFFLQFYPDLIRNGHLYILQTPLFRVRTKKKTLYCYNEQEKLKAIEKLGKNAEITRFKGLGEISPDEFAHFIGEKMRLDPVLMSSSFTVDEMLRFYMGKNTPARQQFIIENLVVEDDLM